MNKPSSTASSIMITSPCAGWVSLLDEAPDPVFSEKMMGGGLLLSPLEGEIRAPCNGEILSVARTQHAITIKASNGAEILIHIGIDTVKHAKGKFQLHVQEGQSITAGMRLVSYDLDELAHCAKSLATPIIVTNCENFEMTNFHTGLVKTGDTLFSLRPISNTPSKKGLGAKSENETSTKTAQTSVRLPLAHGLHARPAARLASEAKQFQSRITILHNKTKADARSPMRLMALGTKLGDTLLISATGHDAKRAVQSISQHIELGLGETPCALPAEFLSTTKTPTSITLDESLVLKGTMGASGLAIGKTRHWSPPKFQYPEQGQDVTIERHAIDTALATVQGNLQALITASDGADTLQINILNAHSAMLEDPVFLNDIDNHITAHKSAPYAWHAAVQDVIHTLQALDHSRMSERADDIHDLDIQVLSVLLGNANQSIAPIQAGSIVVAQDMFPSQFIKLADQGIAGLCLSKGGATSHVSILAADKDIPTLIGLDPNITTIPDGTIVVLNADKQKLHVAPTKTHLKTEKTALKKRLAYKKSAKENAHTDCQTKDGIRINVHANLGSTQDVPTAIAMGAEGCGLLRSEFLFMGKTLPPTEDEQLENYQQIADGLDGRPLIIRTLDIGGDKPVCFINIPEEENPALGLRGIRVSLQNEDLFLSQIRAILRVKAHPPLHIMLPMITGLAEFQHAKSLVNTARKQIGSSEQNLSLGVMIETPAAAMLADQLAHEADFFSIGTNDLSQYVLAMDRGNTNLADQLDALHPAVLRMISQTAKAANTYAKSVSVCGGLASDLTAIPILIGLGITNLSGTMARVPELKAFIRTLNTKDCQSAAQHCLELSGADDIRAYITKQWPRLADWT